MGGWSLRCGSTNRSPAYREEGEENPKSSDCPQQLTMAVFV